ncbi:carboxylesterase [Striga asiatica]|uniref:Carboxylesterase n=1 Tax=Striga asiatica TaxID=4170 RepID=A0A5A7RAD9_STRAF|nr:carboxylesterase [Striga asiatica]
MNILKVVKVNHIILIPLEALRPTDIISLNLPEKVSPESIILRKRSEKPGVQNTTTAQVLQIIRTSKCSENTSCESHRRSFKPRADNPPLNPHKNTILSVLTIRLFPVEILTFSASGSVDLVEHGYNLSV